VHNTSRPAFTAKKKFTVMPLKSRWSCDLPVCSIATLLFGSPGGKVSDKPVLIDAENPDTKFLTLESYRLWCKRLAVGLQNHGFRPGDRLLLYSGNNIYFPVVFIGTTMAGGIFSGANPGYVARELAYQLRDCDPKFLLVSSSSLQAGLEAAAQANFPKSNLLVFDDSRQGTPQQGCRHWSDLLAPADRAKEFAWNECKTPEEYNQTIALNYSSGTTGFPKGVEITHRNYVANIVQQWYMFTLREGWEEEVKSERWLCLLPMYHSYGQTFFAVQGPMNGIPVYVMPRFDFVKMMDAIQRFRISALHLVPPIVVAMAKHPEVRKWTWDLGSVKGVGCGAAPLGREICKEFESLWRGRQGAADVNIRQGYGMTECVPRPFEVMVYEPRGLTRVP
jgi:4-coumarate--CoA ligase